MADDVDDQWDPPPLILEHVCIKCGLTDPESEDMIPLFKKEDAPADYLSAWVHQRCLFE